MKKYLFAFALCALPMPSQASAVDVARATKRFWNGVALTAWIAFVSAPGLFSTVSLVQMAAKGRDMQSR